LTVTDRPVIASAPEPIRRSAVENATLGAAGFDPHATTRETAAATAERRSHAIPVRTLRISLSWPRRTGTRRI
jgi:hypothetical protein